LLHALNGIKGYQDIEEEHAAVENMSVPAYRAKIREEKQYLFNTSFLTPNKVGEMMKELERV
jgi:hypothetical protein